jgi:glycosyltransferase involved in cell wall biosynthesis
MRIMVSSSTYAPAMNGQAVFTTNLAEGLVKLGHQVMVVLDSQHAKASTTYINGVQLEELHSISLNKFRSGVYFSPFSTREISRLFMVFRPDVVHIQDHYPSCRQVVKVALENQIKLVGSNHFIPENLAPYIPLYSSLESMIYWLLWQWMLNLYKRLDVVIAQSAAAASILKKVGLKSPIYPISCGIDTQRYFPDPNVDRATLRQSYGLDTGKITFLFLGRIDGEKRVDLLLQAMQQLDRDDIQLAIAGHGSVEESMKRMAAKMNLQGRVKFTGFIPSENKPGLLNSVDVFVMPSEAELLSISTLEAMACGRPVLLANALALPELVKDDLNGYLFTPGDVKDLARLMGELADQSQNWGEMGSVSREIALQHDLDKVIHKYERIYDQLISAAPVTKMDQELKGIA